ncbi:hypothetical protein TNCV_1349891 [Trichonephila clavipes]|nr:hypothetical protein TNCV_1349891 [Trichonephila clavipes]
MNFRAFNDSSLPVPTGDVVSPVFIESSALVVTIHPSMAVEQAGLVNREVKPVEVYSQKVMSDGWTKPGNSLGSFQMPRDMTSSAVTRLPMAFQGYWFLGLANY